MTDKNEKPFPYIPGSSLTPPFFAGPTGSESKHLPSNLPPRLCAASADLSARLVALTGFLAQHGRPTARTEAGVPYHELSPKLETIWGHAVLAAFEAVVAIARQTPAEFGIDS